MNMESFDGISSPLFPQLALSSETSLKLPSKPLAHSGSVQLYLILAEKNLYIQGFEENEYKERPPLLLRGSLFLKVSKPVKIKLINLKFSGVAKTDWPEGIPPKKTEYLEIQQLIQHNWPFFSANININDPNKGANIFRPQSPHEEISSFSLEPLTNNNNNNKDKDNNNNKESSGSLAHVLRRATSPSPIRSSRSRSNTTTGNAASTLFSHLTGTTSNVLDTTSSNDLQSNRSIETLNDGSSNKTFLPGDYIYNFELPIPASTPETISVTFGSVSYVLEASVERSGAFKTSISGKETINVIRTPSDLSLEENEPIAILRDWEDRLRYEIVIASKAVVLNTYLPLLFKLTPLEKIQLHRIRVYLTENLEYYCKHKKIHRLEPTKKYLLLEHKPENGVNSLLGDEEISARELEFQLYVPEKLNDKQKLHPDTSYSNIQSHHWIKICLRLSKPNPTEDNPNKRKHYEITIDSPIHILSPMATHANTLLPSYDQLAPLQMDYMRNPPLSPNVILVDNSLDAMISSPQKKSSHHHNNNNKNNTNTGHSNSSNNIHNQNININNNDPYYVQPNMNLGSNLYKPSNVLPELLSPQAQPFSPLISPEMAALSPNLHAMSSPGLNGMNSPSMMARPIHLLRRPSINPPPFSADSPPPPCNDEPPAYQERDENQIENHHQDKQQNGEADIGETFAFLGLSPDLPNSILRATSPVARSRSATRMTLPNNGGGGGGKNTNVVVDPVPPKPTSNSPSSSNIPSPKLVMMTLPKSRLPRTAESFLNDLDGDDHIITADFPALIPNHPVSPLAQHIIPANRPTSPLAHTMIPNQQTSPLIQSSTIVNDIVPSHSPPKLGHQMAFPHIPPPSSQQVGNNSLSPTSSIASSNHSISSADTQFDPIGEPLLNSITSTSTVDQQHLQQTRPGGERDRFQSILSSMDITSMYDNNNNTNTSLINSLNQQRSDSIWHPLDSDFTHINNPHLFKKPPVFNAKYNGGNNDVNNDDNDKKIISGDKDQLQAIPMRLSELGRHMSFGVEQIESSLPSMPSSSSMSTIIPPESSSSSSMPQTTSPSRLESPSLVASITSTTPETMTSSTSATTATTTNTTTIRDTISAGSDGNSLNSNNSSSTLKTNISGDETADSPQQRVGIPETRKFSSTSSTRQTVNQDTAY